MITINKTSEILKQINFRKINRFYKLASQRLMVFIDDSTVAGENTLYGSPDKIPKEWKSTKKDDKYARREFIFTRSDIIFYINENFVNPPTVYEELVFSVDKYQKYEKNKVNCSELRGEAISQIIEKGHLNNFDEDHRKEILKPNIFTNELFEYCNLTVINPTEKNALNKFSNTILVHYLIPNVESSIVRYDQIYNFGKDDDYNGHHNEYTFIKFI